MIEDLSPHFILKQHLPQLDEDTKVSDVLDKLAQMEISGFVVKKGNDQDVYVKGCALAQQVIEAADGDSTRFAAIAAQPILEAIAELNVPVIKVPQEPIDAAADDAATPLLNVTEELVVEVHRAGRHVGWLLNHETLVATLTGRLVYICEKGHVNPDADAGTCYSCPFKIVRTEQRAPMIAT